MRPVLLSFGSLHIYSWGFLLALATLLGALGAVELARRSGWEHPDAVLDVALGAVLAGVVGSRLNYLLLYRAAEFWRRPWIFFQFSAGGLVFHGGLALGILAGGYLARRRGLGFWTTGDVLAPFLAAGYGLVRVGCFLNGCCYGRVTHVPWAVVIPALADGLPRHPSQLYAAALGLFLGVLLLLFYRRRPFSGAVFLAYMGGGALERIIEDFFRDTLMYSANFTLAQVVSAGVFLVAVALYIWRSRRAAREKSLGATQ
ncbi:prolipoprotein diacylglyceryl transferase [Gelria sp. Kuro-4]|uniref:prolipoprotein diacylglyceryl transferase n=1 Tax=Gelria sp. Kuro-4 TaxID=2796927 RepID=UPI001BF045BE|nr:prolipoprotein diacylglyceryl transferase [Gelria sp. Kuro-4]MDI3522622.1 phosphatidylglycerol---prolipoprotein diacylglyceryl transferase [Bacillota bacterium]MDK2927679.1 phosphatidylglycerol---prolipoprotein diacylglyceryl transferase [Bacillota bacterium]BCV24446.1 prolipoprotein diacylglyceryl transferase [Gelria sp. Kuro-4]